MSCHGCLSGSADKANVQLEPVGSSWFQVKGGSCSFQKGQLDRTLFPSKPVAVSPRKGQRPTGSKSGGGTGKEERVTHAAGSNRPPPAPSSRTRPGWRDAKERRVKRTVGEETSTKAWGPKAKKTKGEIMRSQAEARDHELRGATRKKSKRNFVPTLSPPPFFPQRREGERKGEGEIEIEKEGKARHSIA